MGVNVWRGFEQTNIQVYHGTLLGYSYMRLIFILTQVLQTTAAHRSTGLKRQEADLGILLPTFVAKVTPNLNM